MHHVCQVVNCTFKWDMRKADTTLFRKQSLLSPCQQPSGTFDAVSCCTPDMQHVRRMMQYRTADNLVYCHVEALAPGHGYPGIKVVELGRAQRNRLVLNLVDLWKARQRSETRGWCFERKSRTLAISFLCRRTSSLSIFFLSCSSFLSLSMKTKT